MHNLLTQQRRELNKRINRQPRRQKGDEGIEKELTDTNTVGTDSSCKHVHRMIEKRQTNRVWERRRGRPSIQRLRRKMSSDADGQGWKGTA